MAIMFDESTEQLVIYCRYIVKDTGELESCFLKVINILGPSETDDADGEGDTHSCQFKCRCNYNSHLSLSESKLT